MCAKRTQARFSARMVKGARSSVHMPEFIFPQLATLQDDVPAGPDWVHEIKLDGYRLQGHVDRGRITIYTRSGLDWTKRFPTIADDLAALPVDRAIFDGELVVQVMGRTNFSELQADLKNSRRDRLQFYVFDLLFFEGFDLRDASLIDRKAVLAKLFAEAGKTGQLLYSQHLDALHGEAMFKHACALNWEGIISKLKNSPYRSQRSKSWLKVKCAQEGRFPVIGFVKSDNGDTIASLHLGHAGDGGLIYRGKVGTGFSRQTARSIWQRMNKVVTPASALIRKARIPKARWVEPHYYASVEYRDITNDGLLRHCSFIGLYDRPQGGSELSGSKHAKQQEAPEPSPELITSGWQSRRRKRDPWRD